MKLIAAVNENWGIGKGNDLLYRIKEDMKFFRRTTENNIIIIGRKTLESFPNGEPLKNRTNIVLTNNPSYKKENTVIANGIGELFGILSAYPSDRIYVCGGGTVYRALLPYCDEALITMVHDKKAADIFFPDLDKMPNWETTYTSEKFEENGLFFSFMRYKNICPESYIE